MSFADLLRVAPDSTPDLAAIDAAATPGFDGDKDAARATLGPVLAQLGDQAPLASLMETLAQRAAAGTMR